MAKVRRESLSETLNVDRVEDVGVRIAGLPEPEEFQETVESDLWQAFAGQEDPGTSVDYESLPDESKSVIGYVDDEKQSAPWWLTSFRWKASSRGEEILLEEGDTFEEELAKIENLDPKATEIYRPSFRNPHGRDTVLDVLEAFENLSAALDERIGIDGSSTDSALPQDIFEIGEESISTTGEFESWFNTLLQLSPPVNGELTSLLMMNAGVKREATDDIVPSELLEKIERLGLSNGEIFESEYYQPLTDIMMLSQVFDLVIPGTARFDELGGLEGLFYENWAEHHDGDGEVHRWIDQASDWDPDSLEEGEEHIFAGIVFSAPLRLKYSKPCYVTLGVNSPQSKNQGYSPVGDRDKTKEINGIMEANGFLEG